MRRRLTGVAWVALALGAVLGLALVVALPARAAADTPWGGRRPTILTLVVNGVPRGESLVLLVPGDALIVDQDLRRAGIEIGGATTQTIRDRRFVSVRSLGIRFVAAELELEIRLDVSADLLPTTRVDLAPPGAPAGLSRPDGASAYLSYGVHATGDADLEHTPARVDGYAEAGVRLAGALVESTVALPARGGPVRGLSSARWDDRDDLRSFVLGDAPAGAGRLGGNLVIGGFHLVRAFELDPYLATAPTLALDGSVLVPSSAEIYVDGALVSRVELPPGRYDLRNIPVTTGAGTTRIVIRDRLGRTRELSDSFYLPAGLLRPGLSDYDLSIGFVRDDLARASFAYRTPAALVRYRRGLGARVTGGLHAEVSLELASGGLELSTGAGLGQLGLELAASADRDARGVAGALAWAFQGRHGGGSVALQAATAGYTNLSLTADEPRLEAHVGGNRALGRRLGLGLQASASRRPAHRWLASAAGTASWSLARGWTLSTTAGAGTDETGQVDWRAGASLSLGLGGRARASMSHEQESDGARDRVELHRSVAPDGGLGFRLAGELGEHSRASGEVELRTGFGRYQLGWLQPADGDGRFEASASGGLVAVGGRLFATQPVERSFALVRIPDARGVRVYLENKPVGRTDRRGELLVTGLLPHYGSRIAIEPADLPDDRPPPRTSAFLAPPSMGGVVVTFPAPALRLARGSLLVERAGRQVVPAYGELVVGAPPSLEDPDSEQWRSPIGGDGAFEIDGLVAGRYPAVIAWEGGRCALTLEVPAVATPINRLGAKVCVEEAR